MTNKSTSSATSSARSASESSVGITKLTPKSASMEVGPKYPITTSIDAILRAAGCCTTVSDSDVV
jgi:hypothetical protein